jgi:hypothetical protein
MRSGCSAEADWDQKASATIDTKKYQKAPFLQKATFLTFCMADCKGPCDLIRISLTKGEHQASPGADWCQIASEAIGFIKAIETLLKKPYITLKSLKSTKNVFK